MDALCRYFCNALPKEIANLVQDHLDRLEKGEFESLLDCPEAQNLFGHNSKDKGNQQDNTLDWTDLIKSQLDRILAGSPVETKLKYFCIGYAALLAFIQSNVTGPPLAFSSAKLLFPDYIASDRQKVRETRKALLAGLSLDGIAAYRLTPNVELLCLAKVILTHETIQQRIDVSRWAKVRVNFMHQRLLSEPSSTLQKIIYDDIDRAYYDLDATEEWLPENEAEYLLERSTIHLHHGFDRLAQDDIEQATRLRQFQFAITGLLGKRTKFQQRDISQLVVLAKSSESLASKQQAGTSGKSAPADHGTNVKDTGTQAWKPENLDLNDDTLLESISFTQKPNAPTAIQDSSTLPSALAELDPSDQPKLDSMDSSILLLVASSIKNTSPEDGLIREETLPYATRVLEGGSSNWQVYTQALLVRSRIEGYRSRTIERGLLQLQALVDQVIADTATADTMETVEGSEAPATSFLPKAKESENAPATERLRYIFQLASPTRWDLEAELAARWVQLGGLRSALDIYERLEMWAEAALCWAATEREDKARRVVRRQLFYRTNGEPEETEVDDDEKWEGAPRDPPPPDAPRLYCILGDIDQSVDMYETAWTVSGDRYARAQRSLGRFHISARNYVKAAAAYSKALTVAQLHQPSWFALGCALLELDQFEKAVQAFTRCVQLDETDAEAWSNLAAALLRTDPEAQAIAQAEQGGNKPVLDDEEDVKEDVAVDAKAAAQNTRLDALKALKRAAALKHDSFRIWDNVLTVAAALMPPDFATVLAAQRRIIDLRGSVEGESCIDADILQGLISYIISTADFYDPSQPGLVRMVVKFMDESVVPLITSSAELWRLVSKLALWRRKPSSALEAEEKGWRAVTSRPGWETESEKRWDEVVEATVRLCDSYESLGQMERTEGMAAGAGELVAKDWKFKARSAIRGIMGRGKDSWQDTDGWERLKETAESLKG